LADSGWVSDHTRKLTAAERRELLDRFGIERAHATRIEVVLTRYQRMTAQARSRPSTDAIRKDLARVARAVQVLARVLEETEDVLEDVWTEPFTWPGHTAEVAVSPYDLQPLRELLSEVETQAWMRTEQLMWVRRDGRPTKSEVWWFIDELSAIYADATEIAPTTPAEVADAKRERLAFLRTTAALVGLTLPTSLRIHKPR